MYIWRLMPLPPAPECGWINTLTCVLGNYTSAIIFFRHPILFSRKTRILSCWVLKVILLRVRKFI